MYETTRSELSQDPFNERWAQPLGIYGRLGGTAAGDGVVIQLQRQDNSQLSNPQQFFTLYDNDDGQIMIRLIREIDRDVSTCSRRRGSKREGGEKKGGRLVEGEMRRVRDGEKRKGRVREG